MSDEAGAARNGLLAALAAEAECTAAPAAIEGPQGWAHALGGELKHERLLDGLGETWEIAKNTYKPYPCGIVLHPVIDACFDLRKRHALAAADNRFRAAFRPPDYCVPLVGRSMRRLCCTFLSY